MNFGTTSRKAIAFFSMVLLLAAAAVAITQAHGSFQDKGAGQAAPKKLAFRDTVVREADNRLRLRDGFEFVLKGENEVTVRSATASTKESSGFTGSANCYCLKVKEGKEHQGTDCHLFLGSGKATCEASQGICNCALIIKD